MWMLFSGEKNLKQRISSSNLAKPTMTTMIQATIVICLLYIAFASVQVPLLFTTNFDDLSFSNSDDHNRNNNLISLNRRGLFRADQSARLDPPPAAPARPEPLARRRAVSGLDLGSGAAADELAREAIMAGNMLWVEAETYNGVSLLAPSPHVGPRSHESACPSSVTATSSELSQSRNVAAIPCGMTVGSSVTVVGTPKVVSGEVSEFRIELLGLNSVEGGEEPPKVMHLNPRLKGDWSGRPVIELNTCYRMQWGPAQRCQGWGSIPEEDTVDNKVKCEKWIQGDANHLEEVNAKWWLNKLVGSRNKKVAFDWPFPFTEGKLFVLTISARLEGYHINVDGRHIASFPYRPGFTLEDATGISVSGDVDVLSVFAASLPLVHPSAPERGLEMSSKWRAPPIPKGEIELFIGILSAGNHFTERMAVRKTWMQHKLVKSSKVVARFFVALNAQKDVNAQLKKEAEFFGDVVIVPYLDNYDLVVLKTVAICEHGVRSMSAKKIMKCDDDTFINLDAVLREAREIPEGKSFYVGNMNYYHKPLRSGKWAVTPEEWPEEVYPPYANGPGYIMSSDIANFTVSEYERNKLRLFKMEDVSMGMWVEKFNETNPVKYVHSLKFCQFGCIEDYFTAHYQSPKQMICMWEKLQWQIRPQCCNMR